VAVGLVWFVYVYLGEERRRRERAERL